MTYYRRFSICSLLAIAPDDDDDGTTAKATTIVNREVKLRNLVTELNLTNRTVTKLVQHHFGIHCRISSMTPAEFEQLLTLMRETANHAAGNNHQTNGVVR